mmetsp:Transcript_67460/g.152665  ORF Transcript_67460/g.152665 Transcript_67460/m.152665 type:complete len:303 (-) Transcript_67460:176-1084(-)
MLSTLTRLLLIELSTGFLHSNGLDGVWKSAFHSHRVVGRLGTDECAAQGPTSTPEPWLHWGKRSARRAEDRERTPREVCGRCSRPPAVCLCGCLPERPIEVPGVRVLVLQHPNERKKKTVSTVPLLPLSLAQVDVKVAYGFEAESLGPLRGAVRDGLQPLLLYPGPQAVSLDGGGGPPGESEKGGPGFKSGPNGVLLILLDGTWSQAKTIARDSPTVLAAVTQVAFTGESESPYDRVRKEPDRHCVSTLEACCKALKLIKGPGCRATAAVTGHLEASLEALVEGQLGHVKAGVPRYSDHQED